MIQAGSPMIRVQSLDGIHSVNVEPDFGVGRVVAEAHGVPQGRDTHDIDCNQLKSSYFFGVVKGSIQTIE